VVSPAVSKCNVKERPVHETDLYEIEARPLKAHVSAQKCSSVLPLQTDN
jgi:hypothetical protein